MDTHFPIVPIASSFILMLLVAIAYGAGATWVADRWAGRGLVALWLAVSVIAAGLFVLRLDSLFGDREVPNPFGTPFPAFWLYIVFWGLAFGAVTLYIAQRRRRGRAGFGPGAAFGSAGWFIAGLLIFFVAFAAIEASRLV